MNDTLLGRTFSGPELAEAAGLSYRRVPAHVWAKIEIVDGHWLWTGALTGGGYGELTLARRAWRAHVFFYTMLIGPVPEGLELDHVCKIKRCVCPFPEHLEPVTHAENIRRHYDTETCANGHRWADGNEYRSPSKGRRECRACNRDRQRRTYERRKAAA